MKKTKISLLLVCLWFGLNAQISDENPLRMKNVHLNLLGDISMASINYEIDFLSKTSFRLLGNMGLGFNNKRQICIFNSCSDGGYTAVVTNRISGILGKKDHFLELGIGGSYVYDLEYVVYPILGYRFTPKGNNNYFLRVYASYPLGGYKETTVLSMPVGISLGKRI